MDDEEKLLAQASGQHVVENTDPGKAPAILRHALQQVGNVFGPEESPGRFVCLLQFNILFVTVTDISRPCQPQKLIPLLP